MKIAIGSDHAGFRYKEMIKEFLEKNGNDVQDFGAFSSESSDYPKFVRPVAEAVARGEFERGIVLGGSGNGEAMVANRIPGIRCALCWNEETARFARRHNDANMLSLGQRMIPEETVLAIVKVWLETPFDGGRHLRRIRQIDNPVHEDESGGARNREGRQLEPKKKAVQSGRLKKWDVLISFRQIKYFEGDSEIEFRVDPGLKEPTVIHVPSPESWKAEMPEWARDRREEILGRLKPKVAHMKPEWREY